MGSTGWRRIFRRESKTGAAPAVEEAASEQSPCSRPGEIKTKTKAKAKANRGNSKLSFFSGVTPAPSSLQCRTKCTAPATVPSENRDEVPYKEARPAWRSRTPPPLSRLKRLFQSSSSSTSSSPRSPSPFAFFNKSSRSGCGICGRSVKSSGPAGSTAPAPAVFTAECSHIFHSRCMVAHVRSLGRSTPLTCPVCSLPWLHPPLIAATFNEASATPSPSPEAAVHDRRKQPPPPNCKSYSDDESLSLSNRSTHKNGRGHGGNRGGAGFNPIPEADNEEEGSGSDESEGDEIDDEHRRRQSSITTTSREEQSSNLAVSVTPDTALVSSGRRHASYVVAVRLKAPPVQSLSAGRRAPMDLVTVLEVSPGMTADKLQALKRAMRPVIESLGPADRLSVVAYSGGASKRLLPLRRMTRQGQRTARQIVDRLVVSSGNQKGDATSASAGEALRKATRVLEDRRECNPVATIMLLSESYLQQQEQSNNSQPLDDKKKKNNHGTTGVSVTSTHFARLEVPLGEEKKGPRVEDALTKCVGGLRSLVMRDVHLQFQLPSAQGEVTAAYCSSAAAVSGGTGSSIHLGDLCAEEEREILLELRVPLHHQSRLEPLSLIVKCSYRDPATLAVLAGLEKPAVLLPPLRTRNSGASIRVRNGFVSTRAVVESRRLVGLNDYATALHLLSSARSLLLQSPQPEVEDLVQRVEAEQAEIQRRRRRRQQQQQQQAVRVGMTEEAEREREDRGRREALTPTSAWRAAEQLAKVAIMRKSMNRVSDLHGFENARF